MQKIYILLLISNFFSFQIIAQKDIQINLEHFFSGEEGFRDAKKSILEGDSYFIENIKTSYHKALESYLKAYDYNSNYTPLNYKKGICYL